MFITAFILPTTVFSLVCNNFSQRNWSKGIVHWIAIIWTFRIVRESTQGIHLYTISHILYDVFLSYTVSPKFIFPHECFNISSHVSYSMRNGLTLMNFSKIFSVGARLLNFFWSDWGYSLLLLLIYQLLTIWSIIRMFNINVVFR